MNSIIAHLRKYGHAVIGSHTPEGQWIAYTIGLTDKYGYELFVSGLRMEIAQRILNDVADGLAHGAALEVGVPDDRWANMPCKWAKAGPNARNHVFQADYHYDRPVEVMQMVLPDKLGRFPEDTGYDPHMLKAQVLL